MTEAIKRRPRVFTIGHSNRTIDAFFRTLEHSSVKIVVDVRSNPSSIRYSHYDRHTLSHELSTIGISYRWFRSLGGRVAPTDKDNVHDALPESLRSYAERMNQSDFNDVANELFGLISSATTAIMCAELDYHRCHRWLLSDKLVTMGARVTHLLEAEAPVEHVLHADLELSDGYISYPSHQLSLL